MRNTRYGWLVRPYEILSLVLSRSGLSPEKKRQALLVALTLSKSHLRAQNHDSLIQKQLEQIRKTMAGVQQIKERQSKESMRLLSMQKAMLRGDSAEEH